MAKFHVNIKWKNMLTLFIVGLLLVGCNVQANGVVAKEEGSGASLNYELVAPPYDSDIQQIIQQNKKNTGFKTINKDSNTFVIIHLGQRPSAGYKVVIDKVEKTSDKILITYSEKKPEGMAASVITYPAAVIKLPKTGLPIQVQLTK